MNRIASLCWCLCFVLWGCTPQLTSRFATFEDLVLKPDSDQSESFNKRRNDCRDPLAYAPDTNNLAATPVKYIRLNVHFMNSSDSSSNYYGREAEKFAWGMVQTANETIGRNKKMLLPPGNDTPVLPPRYQYVLTGRPGEKGVYSHFDDELYYYVHKGQNANLFDRRVIEKYGVQLDSVLNIFIMPHHPDSIASPTYNAYGVGVALGKAIKLSGVYENKSPFWTFKGLFNHEVGHIFGLGHTWAFNDGCDDTPRHPGCWDQYGPPPCDSLASNNLMDYNNSQGAWTPCQIGKVHQRMANILSRQRKFLVPTWCELKEEGHVFIRDTVTWNGAKDLEGHLTLERDAHLTVRCRVSLPRNAKITVKPGATLVLDNCQVHNDCGDEWEGIELQREGKHEGRLIYIGAPAVENVRHPIAPKP